MPRPLFLGREPSQAPVVPELFAAARALAKAEHVGGALSARYGPRFVVTPASIPLDMLSAKDFVEVADFDPHQDHLLCIGEHAPAPEAAIHALVFRAKKEVGAIVDLAIAAAPAGVPAVEKGKTTLDTALAVLEALRAADVVALAGKRLLATGRTPQEALERAIAATGGR